LADGGSVTRRSVYGNGRREPRRSTEHGIWSVQVRCGMDLYESLCWI